MKINEKIWNFIDKKKKIIFIILVSIIALLTRLVLIKVVSGDIENFINEWFSELKENGGLFALKLDIGDYNAPYVTILALLTYIPIDPVISVKMVSIIFDYICAFAMMKIVSNLLEKNKNKELYSLLTYAIVLFLPTVVLNSSYWGQADSIYTAFVLISLNFLLENKYMRSFIFLGIAFSFKLQFVFILPLYIVYYISERKFPIYYFLIIPLANAIMCLPAIAFGKSIYSCLMVYVNQTTEWSNYISMNFPGVWNLLFKVYESNNFVIAPEGYISKAAILATILTYALVAFVIFYKKVKFDKQKTIEFALWSVMVATFFLPNMHDRYLFMADILSVLYFIYNKDKIYVPVGITLISLYTYCVYLFENNPIPIQYVSLLNLVLLIIVTKNLFVKYFKEN